MVHTRYVVLAALLLGTAGAGAVAWRHTADLYDEVVGLRGEVTGLQEQLAAAEARADRAESRAVQAESRAGHTSALADRLASRAHTAESAATSASEQAAAAALAEQTALARAEQAFQEAERVKQEAAEAQRRREAELDRLARALDQIAETRRTALGLVTNLGDSIEFDFGKADLRPANREVLARIAGVLMTAEGFGIQVWGHTDDVGTATANERLSEQRAKAVRDYLVRAGVQPEVIVSSGLGETEPLVRGTTDAARQRNRRVEIAIVQSEGGGAGAAPEAGDAAAAGR